jgi:hypothetical protein
MMALSSHHHGRAPTQWRRGTQRAQTRAGAVTPRHGDEIKRPVSTSPWAGLTRPPSGDAGLNARGRARLGGAVEPRHGELLEAEMRHQNVTMAGPDPPTQW